MNKNLFLEGLKVAKTFDVSTPKDKLVLYSITNLPTKENREQAFAYVASHPGSMMIEHTPCGAKLVEMGFLSSESGVSQEELVLIWKEASKRMINSAKGNVTAFVKNADSTSVFRTMELPTILNNAHIKTINGEDKFSFAEQFKN